MTIKEINETLERLREAAWKAEQTYIENGGEVTADTELLEQIKTDAADLLCTEGIDTLGRWLKGKEDELATYKDEKAMADRKIKSVKNTIDFIKRTVGDILRATHQDKVKGSFYSFQQTVSTSTKVDAAAVDAEWLDAVTEAARNAGLPEWADVAIITNVKRIQAVGLDCYLTTEETPTAKYNKPSKSKEDKSDE